MKVMINSFGEQIKMKKSELLKMMDDKLLESLFGFCYVRTNDSYEAQELCSDIVFALVKTARTDGEIDKPLPFIWRVARNVYANYSDSRKRRGELFYEGDAEELLLLLPAQEDAADDSDELMKIVFARIAFLTRAYREVMILFYIEGKSTAQIAGLTGASETAVRQRLFSARKKLRSEVTEMLDETGKNQKPVVLDKINLSIWGNGDPKAGDPRNVCTRQFSKHIVWLCRKKPMSAVGIAEELHVPTVYVEEELEILQKGENGQYGLLRRMENGLYAINFVLFDRETMEEAAAIYQEYLPDVTAKIADFVKSHKEEYLTYPYLNKKTDLNLVLWQQTEHMIGEFRFAVQEILSKKYFKNVEQSKRPFTVYGYDAAKGYYESGSMNGAYGQNICGYSEVYCCNIGNRWIRQHFDCGLNVALDSQIQLALRAVEGLDISTLSEAEKEHAAKAVECGYLYREGERLYTKILVCKLKESVKCHYNSIFYDAANQFYAASGPESCCDEKTEEIAGKIADLIHKHVPEHLLGDYEAAAWLADLQVPDQLLGSLIEQGLLVPPKDGVGAEGCWIFVKK